MIVTEPRPLDDDSIDLFELFLTLWDGKWKIISTVFLFIAGAFGYIFIQPPAPFTAITEIKPISSLDAEKYSASNAFGLFDILPSTLQNLYMEKLGERTFFEQQILSLKVLDRDDYPTEADYNDEVILFASKIEIMPPLNSNTNEADGNWRLQFEYNNAGKWMRVLRAVDEITTQAVKQDLQERFETALFIAEQDRDFQIEDLDADIEDAYIGYEMKISQRLAFLDEQSAIARTLGVAKNTIEAQLIDTQSGFVANFDSENPYYLRGYEAIEKEMGLIQSRDDKSSFISGLLELQQAKRALEQDRTLERAEQAFATTPIASGDDFKAVSMRPQATNFDYNSNRLLILALSACIGGFIGIIYVLMTNALSSRKERQTAM